MAKRLTVYTITYAGRNPQRRVATTTMANALLLGSEVAPVKKGRKANIDGVSKAWDHTVYIND